MKTILFLAFTVLFISCSEVPEQKIIAEDGAFLINNKIEKYQVLECIDENEDYDYLLFL